MQIQIYLIALIKRHCPCIVSYCTFRNCPSIASGSTIPNRYVASFYVTISIIIKINLKLVISIDSQNDFNGLICQNPAWHQNWEREGIGARNRRRKNPCRLVHSVANVGFSFIKSDVFKSVIATFKDSRKYNKIVEGRIQSLEKTKHFICTHFWFSRKKVPVSHPNLNWCLLHLSQYPLWYHLGLSQLLLSLNLDLSSWFSIH